MYMEYKKCMQSPTQENLYFSDWLKGVFMPVNCYLWTHSIGHGTKNIFK